MYFLCSVPCRQTIPVLPDFSLVGIWVISTVTSDYESRSCAPIAWIFWWMHTWFTPGYPFVVGAADGVPAASVSHQQCSLPSPQQHWILVLSTLVISVHEQPPGSESCTIFHWVGVRNLFSHSSADGQFGCFSFLSMTSKCCHRPTSHMPV